MVSRTVTHALKTLGYLATHRESRIGVQQIARDTGVPANYQSKILGALRRHGIVDSEKGWGGGFQLRPESLELPILDIVKLLDGVNPVEERGCVFGLTECSAEDPCPLHPYWARVKEEMEGMFRLRIRDLEREWR